MIEDPPPLVAAASVERPSAEEVAQFRGAPTSFVVDALGGAGALDWRIKPVAGGALLGVALTCDCGPNDNLALAAAIARSEPGDVIVAATGGFTGAAVVGDLLLGIARNRGVVGFVTDGMVRDLVDLEALGMPVFAMGVTPNSPGRRGPGNGRPADRLRRARDRLGRRRRCRPRRRRQRAARADRRDARQSRAGQGRRSGDARAGARRPEGPAVRRAGARGARRERVGA